MNIFSRINLSYRNITDKNIKIRTIKDYFWDKVENTGLIVRLAFVALMYFTNLTLFYHFIEIRTLIIMGICNIIIGLGFYKRYKILTLTSCIVLFTILHHIFINGHNFQQIKHYTYADIKGTVSSISIKKRTSSFIISHVSISPYNHRKSQNKYKAISGKILAYTNSKEIYNLKSGMKIHTVSAIKPYTGSQLPLKTLTIYRGWFERIYGYSFINRHITILSSDNTYNHSNFLQNLSYSLKNIRLDIQNRIIKLFPPQNNPVNSVMLALITGNKGFITEKTYSNFREAGLSHLLAISGLHIGIVTMSIFVFIRFLLIMIPKSHLYVNNKVVSAGLTLIFTTAYIAVIEPAPPMIRSGIIIYIILLSMVFRSISSSYYILVVACYIMMIYDPTVVLNASFQLSFFASFVVLYISSVLYKPHVGTYLTIFYMVLIISFSSFVINLCIMPISVYHFHSVSMAGFITNPLVMLLMSFVIMPLIIVSLILYKTFLVKYALLLLSYVLKIVVWVTNFSLNKHFVFKIDLWNGHMASILIIAILFFLIIKSRIKYVILLVIVGLLTALPFMDDDQYNLGVTSSGGLFYAMNNRIIFISKHKSKRTINLLEQSLHKTIVFKRWDKSNKYLEINVNNHSIAYTRRKSLIKTLCKKNKIVIHYGSHELESNIEISKNSSCKIVNIMYNGSMITHVDSSNKMNILFSQKLRKYYVRNKSISLKL